MSHPRQNAASVVPSLPQGDGEQRSSGISRVEGVSQFLYSYGPAAFGLDVPFLNPFEPFPLPDGSDQTKPVSQTLTPVSPEWSGSRQK